MELRFEMNYNRRSMTLMAKAMRTILQEEEDKRSRIIGWVIVAVVAAVLVFSGKMGWTQILAGIALVCFAVYLIWQDSINAFFALQKLPENIRTGMWLFREDGYFSDTEAGESDYSYENIFAMAELENHIFLVFQSKQAQIIDLATVQGGTADDLRRLLRKKTSLTIQKG